MFDAALISVVPPGLSTHSPFHPAINRWAILKRPSGTDNHGNTIRFQEEQDHDQSLRPLGHGDRFRAEPATQLVLETAADDARACQPDQSGISRRNLLGLLALATLIGILPTFHAVPAVAEADKGIEEREPDL